MKADSSFIFAVSLLCAMFLLTGFAIGWITNSHKNYINAYYKKPEIDTIYVAYEIKDGCIDTFFIEWNKLEK